MTIWCLWICLCRPCLKLPLPNPAINFVVGFVCAWKRTPSNLAINFIKNLESPTNGLHIEENGNFRKLKLLHFFTDCAAVHNTPALVSFRFINNVNSLQIYVLVDELLPKSKMSKKENALYSVREFQPQHCFIGEGVKYYLADFSPLVEKLELSLKSISGYHFILSFAISMVNCCDLTCI